MAQLSTADLINNAASGQPDNNNQEIKAVNTRTSDQDIAESSYNKISDKTLVNLREYLTARTYETNEGCMYDNGGGLNTWKANKQTTGTFNAADWDLVGGGAGGDSLSLDPGKLNGLELLGTNPQVLGLNVATASVPGALASADWTTFNNKQNVLGFTPENITQKGIANGYAPTDSSNVIPLAYIPDAVVGSLNYQSAWNASTNSPTISDGTGAKGEYYVVSVAGSQDLGAGSIAFAVGDWVIHNGTEFEKLSTSGGGITSVQGITAPAVSLGTGTENRMTVWDANNIFKNSEIYVIGNRIGLGFEPGNPSFQFQFGNGGTGIGYIPNGGSGYTSSVQQHDGIGMIEHRLIANGAIPETVLRNRVALGQNVVAGAMLALANANSGAAQLNLNPVGVTPDAPENGDMWSTPTKLYYRNQGVNIDLLAAATAAGIQTIVAGSNVAVNSFDPLNPVVSAFSQTTAGILDRTYFTGETVVTSEGTFYLSNRDGKGAVTSVSQTVSVNDNETEYFAQDLLSVPYPIDANISAGSYSGILNGKVGSNSAEQIFIIEIYKTDIDGAPIASGITGAPVGDLGVTVIATASTGIVDLANGNETQISFTAQLTEELILLSTERIRYHVGAKKSGTQGGSVDITVSYGSDHVAHVDVPATVGNATFNTAGVVKMSRNSATSRTYISFDGSDTPNVT